MNVKIAKHRYRKVNGKRLVEVFVNNAQQLFDSKDPAPFRDRDLDNDFVKYIFASFSEFSMSTPIKIVVTINDHETEHLDASAVSNAMDNFFAYEIALQMSEIRQFLRRSLFAFAMGVSVLFLSIGVAQSIEVDSPPGILGVLREGIVIFGWVALWKPLELILFDWYPLVERLRLYKKIKKSEAEIHFLMKEEKGEVQ